MLNLSELQKHKLNKKNKIEAYKASKKFLLFKSFLFKKIMVDISIKTNFILRLRSENCF